MEGSSNCSELVRRAPRIPAVLHLPMLQPSPIAEDLEAASDGRWDPKLARLSARFRLRHLSLRTPICDAQAGTGFNRFFRTTLIANPLVSPPTISCSDWSASLAFRHSASDVCHLNLVSCKSKVSGFMNANTGGLGTTIGCSASVHWLSS